MQGRSRALLGAVSLLGFACNNGALAPADAASSAGASGTTSGSAAPAAGSGGVGGTLAVAAGTGASGVGQSGAGSAGRAGASGGAGGAAVAGSGGAAGSDIPSEHFSFFVTSLEAMRLLSGSQDGFGGDLRHGESSGLAGADKICSEIAESSLPGAGAKGWHAFLSAKSAGPNGAVVHARDRIGTGPWYDRTGRLVAMNLTDLIMTRPQADAAIIDDLPNESGAPNHGSSAVDNHDTVTGSDEQGRYAEGVTCEDWTSIETATTSTGSGGRPGAGEHNGPMCGHTWPARSGQSWIAAHEAPGCAPSVSLAQNGGGSGTGIGNGGGYGGIYCFASLP